MGNVEEELTQSSEMQAQAAAEEVEQVKEQAVDMTAKKPKRVLWVLLGVLIGVLAFASIAVALLHFVQNTASNDSYWNLFDENGFVAAKSGGKWGFIDKSGAYVINPQFDDVTGFAEGVACVKANDLYGYIDKTGSYVINPQFENAGSFSEGLAVVKTGDKYGYIDMEGKYAINPQFDDVTQFKNGIARVKSGELVGFIDKSGKYIINPQFEDAGDFCCGLAAVKSGGKWGYINTEGDVVVSYQFVEAKDFCQDGFAIVRTIDKQYAIIDKTGNFISASTFEGVDYYDSVMCKENGCYNYVYGDYEYCSEHREDSPSSSYSYCDAYGCLNIAYYGDYCTDHNYLE